MQTQKDVTRWTQSELCLVWVAATARHVQTLDIRSRTFGMYYTSTTSTIVVPSASNFTHPYQFTESICCYHSLQLLGTYLTGAHFLPGTWYYLLCMAISKPWVWINEQLQSLHNFNKRLGQIAPSVWLCPKT